MRLTLRLVLACFAAQLAASTNAEVTAIKAVQVPQSVVPDHTVNDLLIDFTDTLGVQQLLVRLSQGALFQFPVSGGHSTWSLPTDSIIALFPPAEFDTYVGLGERTNASLPILILGGAVGIEPAVPLQFDSEELNVAWGSGLSGIAGPQSDFFVARITLTNDASGTIRYLGGLALGDDFFAAGTIQNGVIRFVPEPAGGILAAFALLLGNLCSCRRYFSRASLR